jgi:hypothetical protein
MNANERSKSFVKEGNNFLEVLNSKFKLLKYLLSFAFNDFERSFAFIRERS